jgi:hypothetical protein
MQSPALTFRAQIAPTDLGSRQRSESQQAWPPKTAAPLPVEAPTNDVITSPTDKSVTKETAATTIADRAEPLIQAQKHPYGFSSAPDGASMEKNSSDAGAKKSPEPIYSSILGRVTLKRNETLSRIIKGVYGDFNSKYFKSFINVNPDIEDPDRVKVGQVISLPAIPVNVRPSNSPVWWIKIDDRGSLEDAFNILRNQPGTYPEGMRLIPYWNPSNGIRFALVVDKLFRDENTARNHLQQLPKALSSNSTLLSRWEKQTVYFANPYFN